MLVKLNDVLNYAKENKCAVGAYNTPTFENLFAVIRAAEKRNVPIIIMHAELHEEIAPIDEIGPLMVQAAKNSKVPICCLLDHGEHLDYIERALKIGFTGIMYDGSLLPYEDNVKNTIKCVVMAKKFGADVEAEIGVLGGRESLHSSNDIKKEDLYTDPYLALKFVKETNVDALACSFGTAHGIYKSKPCLDFNLLEEIKKLINIPLVMHGGSGVSVDDYRKSISSGIRKINYYSYAAKAGVEAAAEYINTHKNINFYHEISFYVIQKIEEDVGKSMDVFYKRDK